MRAYLACISSNLNLTMRDRTVMFFNYAFPLMFFFIFAELFQAQQGGYIVQVVNMVMVIGVLGSGLFGAGMRAVSEREANILRRFKVAPISASPILTASLVVGLITFLPGVLLIVALAHFFYGMPWPERLPSFLAFVSLGLVAFRGIGVIVASVVNSMQESQILIQILYLPMLFLSGATIPVEALPVWVQVVAQFLPSTYLFNGMQAILEGRETLAQNSAAAGALLLTAVAGTLLGVVLFRWEKEQKVSGKSKLWVLAILGPFLLMGVWQAHTRDAIAKSKVLSRGLSRGRTRLIRGARIFVGDGKVIESGGILIRNGKIAAVYNGTPPDAKSLHAELIEAAGQTVLPGLIDVHVHLSAPGGVLSSAQEYTDPKRIPRELAAYLYSGVTTVKSVGDAVDPVIQARAEIASGERLGASVYLCGPLFTTEGGHGTEFLKYLPPAARAEVAEQIVRLPKTPEEARAMVDVLKARGVDGIKAILDEGQAGMLFNRMELPIFKAVAAQGRSDGLPVVVHTGDARDVADAVEARVDGIEHGSFRDPIPAGLFQRMKEQNETYDPTLAAAEAWTDWQEGNAEPLDRPLAQQVGPASLLAATRKALAKNEQSPAVNLRQGQENLLAAWRAGVTLVAGTDSGNILLIHGPALHRELQLWVEAGIPASVALRAATGNAAALLRAQDRIGLIAVGRDADLLLVDGNPVDDIKRTESIRTVFSKGERIDRPGLFDQE